MRRALGAALGLALLAAPTAAQDRPAIVVTDPSARTYRIAVQRFASGPLEGGAEIAQSLREAVESGLVFSGLFEPVQSEAFLGPTTSPPLDRGDPLVCPNWRQIGADALLQGELTSEGGALRAEFRVRDVQRGCESLLRKRYRAERDDLARAGKAIADDVVEAFTGTPGVADTEIAFISDASGNREVYVMDADGGNVRRATRSGSINSFPDWTPGGDGIVYTSYRYRNRPHLFVLSRGGDSPGRILHSLDGSAIYRGVFHPSDGGRLAVVRSVEGAAEIFSVGRNGEDPERLTKHPALDVGPSWSPDGERIAFVSDRTGSPQIYVMDADGGEVRRLTYDGSYNTSPAWSPDGKWIAYEARAEHQFDVWLIDPSGEVNVPLVTHPRSDESPSWAPDGRKLVFSSTRRGRSDLYVIDVNGENLRRVTRGPGEKTNPAWGPHRD